MGNRGMGWAVVAGIVLLGLYLGERQRTQALEAALAQRDQAIARLNGEILRLRRQGLEDQRLIVQLRQEVATRDQLLRQLQQPPAATA